MLDAGADGSDRVAARPRLAHKAPSLLFIHAMGSCYFIIVIFS